MSVSFKERWADWAKRSTDESRRDWLIMEKVREISPDIDLRLMTDILMVFAVFTIGLLLGQKDIAVPAVIVMFLAYVIRISMLRHKAAKMLKAEGVLSSK